MCCAGGIVAMNLSNMSPEQAEAFIGMFLFAGAYVTVIAIPIILALGIIKLKDIYDKHQQQKPHKGFAALDEKINGRTF